MGLQKDKELDHSGVLVSYWHLAQVIQRFDSNQVEVTFHSYVNEQAYKANKQPAGPVLRYTLTANDFPAGFDLRSLSSQMLYRAAKAKAAAAAKLPRDGNLSRLPELTGIPTDPFLADAADVGVG
jgi:hypothetical protein